MESIIKYLTDPEWWFSTVLVAIIASIIAGFLKDKISELIGHTSRRFRECSQQRRNQEEQLIEALSENSEYLLMGIGKVISRQIMFTASLIIYLLFPIYAEFSPVITKSELSNSLKTILLIAIYPLFGSLSIVFGFQATSSLLVIAKAVKRYRKKHDLPKLP